MDTIGPDGLKVVLAFTALRLELGWATTPITSGKLASLRYRELQAAKLEALTTALLH